MSRSDRRHRTELVIARRTRLHQQCTKWRPVSPHYLHKDDPLGHCGNQHCTICTAERVWKHLAKKRERVQGHRDERQNEAA